MLYARCMHAVNEMYVYCKTIGQTVMDICLHDACMKSAHCLHAVHHFAWDIVGNMVLSTQNNGFHTYFELGGLLQYMLHLKSCSVEVLMFPGICMEENGHKMEF